MTSSKWSILPCPIAKRGQVIWPMEYEKMWHTPYPYGSFKWTYIVWCSLLYYWPLLWEQHVPSSFTLDHRLKWHMPESQQSHSQPEDSWLRNKCLLLKATVTSGFFVIAAKLTNTENVNRIGIALHNNLKTSVTYNSNFYFSAQTTWKQVSFSVSALGCESDSSLRHHLLILELRLRIHPLSETCSSYNRRDRNKRSGGNLQCF